MCGTKSPKGGSVLFRNTSNTGRKSARSLERVWYWFCVQNETGEGRQSRQNSVHLDCPNNYVPAKLPELSGTDRTGRASRKSLVPAEFYDRVERPVRLNTRSILVSSSSLLPVKFPDNPALMVS